MKFKINDNNWQIKEISQKDIRKIISDKAKQNIESEPSIGRYFGVTFHDSQIIYIDKDLPIDRKRKTLIHELTHCYIDMYITHLGKEYSEEDVCDMNANSHDIIHNIVDKYFKR